MDHRINVYVVGPPKSGKSKFINSIKKELSADGVEVHEGLDISGFLANDERMRGDTETPQQTATLPPSHGAACCASSFVFGDYSITIEKTPEAKYRARRSLMSAQWGLEQERRITAKLKIIPLEDYLNEQGLQTPSS